MKTVIEKTAATIAETVAQRITEYINANPNSLLCFAGGDTPLPVYEKLVDRHKKGLVDLHSVFYVSLDEWVGLGDSDKGSCLQMMNIHFYKPAGIPTERLCLLNGKAVNMAKEAFRAESFIREKGGIKLTLLGIGMNGHIGFNEPNCSDKDGVQIVDLDATTCSVGQKYFDGEKELSQGITVSYKELEKADIVMYIVTGAKKATIVKTIMEEEPTHEIPATLLKNHADITLYADADAWGTGLN